MNKNKMGRPKKYQDHKIRSVRFPDDLWNKIPRIKTEFIHKAVNLALNGDAYLTPESARYLREEIGDLVQYRDTLGELEPVIPLIEVEKIIVSMIEGEE